MIRNYPKGRNGDELNCSDRPVQLQTIEGEHSHIFEQPSPPSMASQSPLFRLLTPLLQTFRRNATPLTSNASKTLLQTSTSARTFSTSQQAQAKGGKSGKGPKTDPRITLIRYHLQHPKTPRPLRLSRMRALRHWTIHRAWMLARRKRFEKQEVELYR